MHDRLFLSCPQLETGTPYVCYKDHVNRKSNQSNVGTVRSSNLCVAPETQILTDKGYHAIGELEGQAVRVWNGTRFSDTVVRKTGVDQPLLKVTLSNGEALECTPYHRFYIAGQDETVVVEAKDLKGGDVIAKFGLPVVPDDELASGLDKPYELGLLGSEQVNAVPVNHVLPEKLLWFEGLVHVSGCMSKSLPTSLMVTSSSEPFLRDVKRMLETLGAESRVCEMNDTHFVPYSVLLVDADNLAGLRALGFAPRRELSENLNAKGHLESFGGKSDAIVVVDVVDVGRRDDTFCFTEPLEGKGVFNGILTGQCAEITEVSNSSTYAVCNLASIAVNRFYVGGSYDHARLHEAAKQLTYNLNRVIDVNTYPTEECRSSNLSMRPIGVGVQGFGDLYCLMGLPYDAPEAVALDGEVLETIYHGCVEASAELAERDGPYERFAGSPASEGKLQFDLWGVEPSSGRWDWAALKARIAVTGLRNR
jgi:ribonucleoside-diphosphate reductase alpha chain